MNFQDMDALGGLIEGGKARMAEDTTRINQENTLAQIAKMAQEQQQAAQMHPLKIQELESQNAERSSMGAARAQQTAESKARVTRETGREYVENMIRFGHLPGSEETEAERLGIPATHPVRKALASARKFDSENQGNWGPGEAPQQSKVQELLAALSANDDKSRQATATAEATFKRDSMKQDQITSRADADRASRERIATEAAQAKTKAAEIRAAAQATEHPKTFEAYAIQLMYDVEKAERDSNAQLAATAREKGEKVLALMRQLKTEKDVAIKEAKAIELFKISNGAIDIRGSARAAQGATTAPKAAPAADPTKTTPAANQDAIKKALGKSYDPNKQYEVGPDGTVYELRKK
jgi:hypothetical protein